MTVAANRDPTNRQATPDHEARLIEANVNPRTGLATDYLNHFNEAVMLLELLGEMPECLDDFFAWKPRRYDEHFAASKSRHRDVTLAAYADANPELRQRLDTLANYMNEILMATREVMQQDLSSGSAPAIADLAAQWVKPLVARAGAVINGTEAQCPAEDAVPQTTVDALMAERA